MRQKLSQTPRKEVWKFVEERNEAVFSLDPEKFKAYCKKYFPEKMDAFLIYDDDWARGTMALMCLDIPNCPEEVKAQARVILYHLGWQTFFKD